jgi:hypothetical protein
MGSDSAHRPLTLLLKQDLQSQFQGTAALEQAYRDVEVNVVPHRKSTGRARLVPGTFELFRTPSLDPLDLGRIRQVDVSRRHAFLSRRLSLCSVKRRMRVSP